MFKNKLLILVLVLISVLGSVGVGAAEIKVEHLLGETKLEENPAQVIAFDYASINSLAELGVEVAGLPKSSLPAVLADYQSDQYVDIGTLFEPNFEKIYEMQPDLIIISGRQADLYDQLSEIAPTLYLGIEGNNFMESVKKNAKILGEIFNKEALAAEKLNKIETQVLNLKNKLKAQANEALLIMANDGSLTAYGPGSRFGYVYSEFGFEPIDKNIAVSNHGSSISFEYILEKNPPYILVIDRAAVVGGSTTAKMTLENQLVKATTAYQDDKIIYLNSEIWYVASGGLGTTLTMIEDLEKALN
ncbi:siderophore ABC transporter substrate-binding protein [Halanaerobium praevalens]|uniref:Periplasmic binding protein n=1 Tax=Halanaerobium praevalens (strain ATCC 33744 / DSM 2228 / GSL) TaxID=572479 RepID=E3DME5_HALPG|nr:siderophore ABC transporter substrate-binding protein [Halanaerobium praevalens]ADO76338.1 periplasmic binding protein [Halanaerobium praevalens DSM 2228]